MTALLPYIAMMAALAAVVLWASRATGRGAALYAVLFAAVIAGAIDVMGRPKPFEWEWRQPGEIIGISYHPGIAIYVWVEGAPPRAYALPWSIEMARQAQEAAREGEAMRLDYDEDGEPVIYPDPQPSPPPK